MEPYLFYGVVLPERAQLTLQFNLGFSHYSSDAEGVAKVSIYLNQIAIYIESEYDWNIFDLRNVVKTMIQNELAMVGYLMGYTYEMEITRVLHQSKGIDFVFGIDIPCITNRKTGINLPEALAKLRSKIIGKNGMFLNRCFTDLRSSMKEADDTGFYCYRAIESLRHHCAALHSLTEASKSVQWEKLREVSGCTEETLRSIKLAADPSRHGEVTAGSSEEREKIFKDTWDVVDGYINGI